MGQDLQVGAALLQKLDPSDPRSRTLEDLTFCAPKHGSELATALQTGKFASISLQFSIEIQVGVA